MGQNWKIRKVLGSFGNFRKFWGQFVILEKYRDLIVISHILRFCRDYRYLEDFARIEVSKRMMILLA